MQLKILIYFVIFTPFFHMRYTLLWLLKMQISLNGKCYKKYRVDKVLNLKIENRGTLQGNKGTILQFKNSLLKVFNLLNKVFNLVYRSKSYLLWSLFVNCDMSHNLIWNDSLHINLNLFNFNCVPFIAKTYLRFQYLT